MTDSAEHSSLLQNRINNGHKNIYSTSVMLQKKIFFVTDNKEKY